jgi:hypothetical protein
MAHQELDFGARRDPAFRVRIPKGLRTDSADSVALVVSYAKIAERRSRPPVPLIGGPIDVLVVDAAGHTLERRDEPDPPAMA